MATWKKVVVSGSSLAQLDNSTTNYVTQAGIDFPVDSVNGSTGAVVLPILSGSNFAASSAVDNRLVITEIGGTTTGVTLNSTAVDIPVDSVNGQTGVVVLPILSGSNFAASSAVDNRLVITEIGGTTTGVTLNTTAVDIPVDSVNGQTGVVVLPILSGSNFAASSAVDNRLVITEIGGTTTGVTLASTAAPVDSVNGETGVVVLPILSASNFAASSINNRLVITDIGGATTGVQFGDAEAPVDSVNGQTGAVVLPILSGSNFAASSAVDNRLVITEIGGTTTGVTLNTTAVDIPVDSVNGQTGTVVLPILSGSNFAASSAVDNRLVITEIGGTTTGVTLNTTAVDIPVDSVNGQTGTVVLPILSGSNFAASSAVDNRLVITEIGGTTTGVTLASTAVDIPVDSVNGQTGTVVLPILSGSNFSSNAQGEFTIADIGGVNTTIDLGLQTTDNVQFNNLNVDGNLIVAGTASFRHSQNLDVVDQYITLNSGSGAGAGADSGGIIIAQDAANDKGELFAWLDGASENSENHRWAIASSIPSSQTSNFTPDAFMAAVMKTATGVDTAAEILQEGGSSAGVGYNKPGNIYVDPSDGIWMYS